MKNEALVVIDLQNDIALVYKGIHAQSCASTRLCRDFGALLDVLSEQED